eukprot:830670-Amphidinium_carterae.1
MRLHARGLYARLSSLWNPLYYLILNPEQAAARHKRNKNYETLQRGPTTWWEESRPHINTCHARRNYHNSNPSQKGTMKAHINHESGWCSQMIVKLVGSCAHVRFMLSRPHPMPMDFKTLHHTAQQMLHETLTLKSSSGV